jgi:hypothetical protein
VGAANANPQECGVRIRGVRIADRGVRSAECGLPPPDHRPVNVAARFSTLALKPSAASALSNSRC